MKSRALHAWLLRRWYGERPIAFLIPLSWLFILITALRRLAYRCGLLRAVKLPVPLIVVGNVTVGGTGKTPLVIWLAAALRARGYRPGIVTRGYGGRSRHWPVMVAAASNPAQVGDEAVLLARRTGLPVAAGPDRVAAARLLLNGTSVNVIVSDDGLQHDRLGRNLEIITLDGERGLGNGWRLPAGPLRESARRLERVDLVVIKTGARSSGRLPAGALAMRLVVENITSLDGGGSASLESFSGQPVHAVAGIGHPQQFFALLAAHGLRVDAHPLPDHAPGTRADFEFRDGRPVFMTEKDAIKCHGFIASNHWCVRVAASFSERDAVRLIARVTQRLRDVTTAPGQAGSG